MSVSGELGFSAELEKYVQHTDGETNEMTLRTTQMYRREDGRWRIIHRYGDILTPVEVKS